MRLHLVFCLLVAFMASPVAAHKGHQHDMSDAEMAAEEAAAAQPVQADVPAHPHSAGAGTAPDNAAAPAPDAQTALEARIAENRLTSLGDLLSRLHPAVVHFPIALLLVAALAELLLIARPTMGLEPTVRFLVAGGALGAVTAALFGWFAGGWRLTDRSETLGIHRWNGTAIALVALGLWWLPARGRRASLRAGLAVVAVALVVQGYYGGEMTFGPNHLGLF